VGESFFLEQLDALTVVDTFFFNFWIGLIGRAFDIALSLVAVVHQQCSVV
jgi:hypothetical protein